MCARVSAEACRSLGASDPLELELLQAAVSCLLWVLGSEPRSSTVAASVLSC